MEPTNLLYREPRLYDLVFPDAEDRLGRMCREAWRRYLPAAPRSVLDIGCGTGRLLESLSGDNPECWGVDLLASNIEYASSVRPQLRLFLGDMRSFRLGRTFGLDGDGFRERIEASVDTPQFRASSVSIHSLDPARRLLTRTRLWRIPGSPEIEDHAEYRLLYPDELVRLLDTGGFEVVGLFDNRDFRSSGLRGRAVAVPDASGMGGRKLYAFARRR